MKPELQDRLTEALDDEYKVRTTYRRVIEKFGPALPFANIVEAEQRHVDALMAVFEVYRLPIPEDSWPARVTAPDTVDEACHAAVAAEQENLKMYDRLLAATPEPDVRRVLENLQAASRDRHLPAFERCLSRRQEPADGSALRAHRGRARHRFESRSDR